MNTCMYYIWFIDEENGDGSSGMPHRGIVKFTYCSSQMLGSNDVDTSDEEDEDVEAEDGDDSDGGVERPKTASSRPKTGSSRPKTGTTRPKTGNQNNKNQRKSLRPPLRHQPHIDTSDGYDPVVGVRRALLYLTAMDESRLPNMCPQGPMDMARVSKRKPSNSNVTNVGSVSEVSNDGVQSEEPTNDLTRTVTLNQQ